MKTYKIQATVKVVIDLQMPLEVEDETLGPEDVEELALKEISEVGIGHWWPRLSVNWTTEEIEFKYCSIKEVIND